MSITVFCYLQKAFIGHTTLLFFQSEKFVLFSGHGAPRKMRVSISSWLLLLLPTVFAQYNSQTYPDPHLDPFTCRVTLPGPVCDPSAILLNEERTRIAQRIQQVATTNDFFKSKNLKRKLRSLVTALVR